MVRSIAAGGSGLIAFVLVGCASSDPPWPLAPAVAPSETESLAARQARPPGDDTSTPTQVIHPMLARSRPGVLPPNARGRRNAYAQTNLVASSEDHAPTVGVDAVLVDAWGMTISPQGQGDAGDNGAAAHGGRMVIACAGSGVALASAGDLPGVNLHPAPPVAITIPTSRVFAAHTDKLAEPTGVVSTAHSRTDFVVSGEGVTAPSELVFVGLDGNVCGWAPGQTRAVSMFDRSVEGSAFTGCAVTDRPSGNRLYICDSGLAAVLVLDHEFKPVQAAGDFRHPEALSHAPHNVWVHAGELYVAFTRTPSAPEDSYPGYLGVFDLDGRFLRSFEHRMELNAPWGMAMAPDDYGAMSGALLVSNFGDGTIVAFDPASGRYIDYVRADDGAPFIIEGIWSIGFGDGQQAGHANHLYFTAGPNLEEGGLFGKLAPLQP